MGNPLVPALANIFLCNCEEGMFRTCPDNIKPKFYKRYLDDTFAVFGNEHQAISFYNFINFVHNNIKFTAEHQSNNQLQFLDLNIFNVDDSFTSKVCRKPTFSGLCLSFYSYCPILYKINSIKTLLHRAYQLSSNCRFFTDEIDYLKMFFSNNGYPSNFLDSINKFINNLINRKPKSCTVERKTVYYYFPYFGPLSLELAERINKILKSNYPYLQFKFSFKNTFKIGYFFIIKITCLSIYAPK